MPLPRLFDDPGRCADVVPGVLRAWVPARLMVGQDQGPELMVGMPNDLRPITERDCLPDSLSLPRDLWWRVRYSDLGVRLLGRSRESRHPAGLCRWCGFYADAAARSSPRYGHRRRGRPRRAGPSPGRVLLGPTADAARGVAAGLVRPPRAAGIAAHDQPAVAVGGFDWVDGEGKTEAVSLCRSCCEDWRYGTVFDPNWLGASMYRSTGCAERRDGAPSNGGQTGDQLDELWPGAGRSM